MRGDAYEAEDTVLLGISRCVLDNRCIMTFELLGKDIRVQDAFNQRLESGLGFDGRRLSS